MFLAVYRNTTKTDMMTNYDIEQAQQADEKVKELFRICDTYIPVSMQARFTEYDQLRQDICGMIEDYWKGVDEFREMEEKVDELEKWKEQATEALGGIWSQLHTFRNYIADTEDRGNDLGVWDEEIEKLVELADGKIPQTVKRKRK